MLAIIFILGAGPIAPPPPDPPPPVPVTGRSVGFSPNHDNNPYNGYYWYDDNWVPGMVTVATWFRSAPLYSFAGATFYAPYVMEGTARWRGFNLAGYLDGVSLMSPSDIGATVWLKRPGGQWEGPYLVVDCAARNDIYSTITSRHEIVEVGFETAKRWGMVVPKETGGWRTAHWTIPNVEVIKSRALPIWAQNDSPERPEPTDFVAWWKSQVMFSVSNESHPYYVRPGGWDMRDGGPVRHWFDFQIAQPANRDHTAIAVQDTGSLR